MNSMRKMKQATTILWLTVGWSVFIVMTGCATTQSTELQVSDNDPLESVNRPIYWVNDFLDRTIAEPVVDVYINYAPQPVQESVSNFFDNVSYPNVILNDFLQGKGIQGLKDSGRFLVNSTFGFFGIWDMATPLGLEAHDEDFGQTLGVWGMDESLYLVLPFIGPSSIRDAPNLGITTVANILFYMSNPVVVPVALLGFIDKRAKMEEAITFRDKTAVEPYLFTREAYLQHRKFLIYDGDPPIDDDFSFDDPFTDREVEEEGSLQEEAAKLKNPSTRKLETLLTPKQVSLQTLRPSPFLFDPPFFPSLFGNHSYSLTPHHPLCSNSTIRAGRITNAQTRAKIKTTTSKTPKLAMPGWCENPRAPKEAIVVKALQSTA